MPICDPQVNPYLSKSGTKRGIQASEHFRINPINSHHYLRIIGRTMLTATVSPNGQVTLPTEILIALGLKPGDRMIFVKLENGNYAVVPRTHSVKKLNGMLRRPAQKPVSPEEMDQAIAKGAAGNDRA